MRHGSKSIPQRLAEINASVDNLETKSFMRAQRLFVINPCIGRHLETSLREAWAARIAIGKSAGHPTDYKASSDLLEVLLKPRVGPEH